MWPLLPQADGGGRPKPQTINWAWVYQTLADRFGWTYEQIDGTTIDQIFSALSKQTHDGSMIGPGSLEFVEHWNRQRQHAIESALKVYRG